MEALILCTLYITSKNFLFTALIGSNIFSFVLDLIAKFWNILESHQWLSTIVLQCISKDDCVYRFSVLSTLFTKLLNFKWIVGYLANISIRGHHFGYIFNVVLLVQWQKPFFFLETIYKKELCTYLYFMFGKVLKKSYFSVSYGN